MLANPPSPIFSSITRDSKLIRAIDFICSVSLTYSSGTIWTYYCFKFRLHPLSLHKIWLWNSYSVFFSFIACSVACHVPLVVWEFALSDYKFMALSIIRRISAGRVVPFCFYALSQSLDNFVPVACGWLKFPMKSANPNFWSSWHTSKTVISDS